MIRVCDAIMGTGKSSAAITYMNEHKDEKFIYITPYLDEANRIKEQCAEMHFMEPSNKIEEFKILIQKSTSILFSVAIPIAIFACIFSPEIIEIISGKGFEGAITATRIVMPLILIIGYEQIIVIQILMPLKKDKAIFVNSIIGATAGILLNILLVASLKNVGSAIVWFMSEIVVLMSAQYFVQKYTSIKFPIKELARNLFAYIPAIALCILIYFTVPGNVFLRFSVAGIFMAIYFLSVQKFYLKNEIILSFIYKLMKK